MTHEVPELNGEEFHKPTIRELKEIASEFRFNKPLRWTKVEDLEEFYALIQKPPLHSVVAHIEPMVAKKILDLANISNRRMIRRHAGRLAKSIKTENYELTGDTLKISKTGVVLDGQHRLTGSVISGMPIITHIVFGLEDRVFDLIDQGKKRSPADVLMKRGFKDASIVAGAVRVVMWYRNGAKRSDDERDARAIREAAEGPLKGVKDWTNHGRQMAQAFKHEPSLMSALLYLISRHDRGVAEDFFQSWLNGARVGRNKGFDMLASRFRSIQAQTGGSSVNRDVKAAMIIQLFNAWHAGVVPQPRALTWRKEWTFPQLQFNKEEYLRGRDTQRSSDTSLQAMEGRVLEAMDALKDGDGNIQVTVRALARRANVPERQMTYVLGGLQKGSFIHKSRDVKVIRPGEFEPAIWRLRPAGETRLRSTIISS
jgi:hypothetical protein